MNGNGIVTTIDLLFRWITRLVAVNVLWFLFSLAGLIVGGIFPATAAALGVTRKWLMGDQELKIWRTYKKLYKQDFIAANIVGWVLTISGAVLYWNYQLIVSGEGQLSIVIPFAFYLVLFFYIIIALWSFPLLAHYNNNWFQYIRNALIIGLSKIHYTIFMGLVIFSIAYFSLSYPGAIPFFPITLAALSSMWAALQVFGKLDDKTA